MFKTNYIYELTSGQLSREGYEHFISAVSYFVRKYNWPKSIIVSSEINTTKFWSAEEVKELTHQFFEWSLSKGKLDNLNKIPENYLSYYFAQILISFIANRIKDEQQKEGLSFEKCRELVTSICKEDYIIQAIEGNEYVFNISFSKEEIKPFDEVADALTYLSKIPIKESTKHFRPLVKLAVEDIYNSIESPISLGKLIEIVYSLFDQKGFNFIESKDELLNEIDLEILSVKFDKIVQNIVSGLTKDEARLISHFLFHNADEQSFATLADIYSLPKSTFHHKIDTFKKKIARSYTPNSEQNGIIFIQNISKALDELSK